MKHLERNSPARVAAALPMIGLFLLATLFTSIPVAAQEADPRIQQEDLNGDGTPDLTIIRTSLATTSDEIRVYDGDGNMDWADSWAEATDFVDDTWIFDVGADGNAQLIVQFSQEEDSVVASLFDDVNGDGRVAHTVSTANIQVSEAPFPSLRVIAENGWFLPGGGLNWNVRFLSDGASPDFVNPFNLTELAHRYLYRDGTPDAELEFRDDDMDGVPEYGLWRLLAWTPPADGHFRTFLWSNEARVRPAAPAASIFWPYLVAELPAAQSYFDVPPVVLMDWSTARLQQVSLMGYPIEHGFHVNSLSYFEKSEDVVNVANFENAQAYYDLAADRDGYPELHIRHRYFEAFDPGNNLPEPINEIRWSWNQANRSDLYWDFNVGLAGRHAITSTVEYPDFSYLTISYEELPAWVLEKQWDMATLFANEGAVSRSSEGIYGWGPVEATVGGDSLNLSRYIAGQIDLDLSDAFKNVGVGWRGEFSPDFAARPRLYFSPVDRRLHLFDADYGIWAVDETTRVHYFDTDGDGHVDSWERNEDEERTEQLFQAGAHLIYANRDSVIIQESDLPEALYETAPPITTNEWASLDALLREHAATFEGPDFRAMLAQAGGTPMTITGASIRDVRILDDGYRFVLNLGSGAATAGMRFFDVPQGEPGDYVVTCRNDCAIQPSFPAELALTLDFGEDTLPIRGRPYLLLVQIDNHGLEDLEEVVLVGGVREADGVYYELAREPGAALSGLQSQHKLTWHPLAAGEADLVFQVTTKGGTALAHVSQVIEVRAGGEERSASTLMTVSAGKGIVPIIAIAFTVVFTAFFITYRVLEGKNPDEA